MLREGDRIQVANTLPDVNLDELLASLDADTRSALVALAQGAGQGLAAGPRAGANFRRFDPTMRLMRGINDEMIGRRREIKRVVTNFSLISQTLARHRGELTRFVRSSNAVFGALAEEQAGVAATLRELPPTLREIDDHERTRSCRWRATSAARRAGCCPARARCAAEPRRWMRCSATRAPWCATSCAPSRAMRWRRCASCAAPPTASHRRAAASRACTGSTASSTTSPTTRRARARRATCSARRGRRTSSTRCFRARTRSAPTPTR